MERIAEFEKVSFEVFYSAMKDMGREMCGEEVYRQIMDNEEVFKKRVLDVYDHIILPTRSTRGSAGYDIHSPVDFELPPHTTVKIPTGIRVRIDDGWFLGCFPRSGLGFKYRLQLNNTIGVVDSDYYNSDNEGHIFLKMTNDTYDKKTLTVECNDRIAQGIFMPYGITLSDSADGVRNGGMGSTDEAQ